MFCILQKCLSSKEKNTTYTNTKPIDSITKPIDSILLRNWVILQEKYEVIGKRKFFISKADLHKSGFHTAYHTTMNINKAGKTYFYIYDFGWMDFSEKELMVIKLNKAK